MAVVVLLSGAVPTLVFAQALSPAETPRGLEILLLGTHGGPALVEQRLEPATLLIVDGRPYLIDCGIGTMRRLVDARVPSETIGTIFITHNHPDHALGLADVLANDYHHVALDEPEGRPAFNIYGPPQTPALVSVAWDFIKIPYAIFAAEPIGRGELMDPFHAHAIDRDGLVYQDDKIRVMAAENTHYQLIPAKYHATMKSFSYRFETRYGSVVFTGDTGPSSRVEALAKDADVLITEVEDLDSIENSERPNAHREAGNKILEHMRTEHLPINAVGELATKAQVKAVILDHFLGGLDGEGFVAGVKKWYSGPVFAGADLARYCMVGDAAGGAAQGTTSGADGSASPSAGSGLTLRPCQ